MNPVCETDISSPLCQQWMSLVCARCRDLFADAATDVWAAWWHDATPAFYKDVTEMTVYDCEKLKHLLELQAAAYSPNQIVVQHTEFAFWQKLALICIYVVILVLLVAVCRRWRKKSYVARQPIDNEREELQQDSSTSILPDETAPPPARRRPKKKQDFKTWMHRMCRPIFVHNTGALHRRQQKYEQNKQLQRVVNERNIEKWTKARHKEPKRENENNETKENKHTNESSL
ncbi:uncharacterized protein LOC111600422 [Drosophila hydei]|uniref:Uncharacterized protein LOC111600422 n=1 Tax=Drosophila hydei TaxID=7224 RepID=A0A6J1M050_DROHY|nr:uncharacterized protein LOC111600422 [Drosophila hydei]